ncbi:hypothetical protein Tco_1220921 [Tanacetum coccineum]
MYPLTALQEGKTRKDYGTKRGRPSTFSCSSSVFGQPSSSHHIDDDNDGNDKGTSCASTPSPTRFVNSVSNDIPQVFSNPPNIDPNMEVFYTRQTEMLNRQVQLRVNAKGEKKSLSLKAKKESSDEECSTSGSEDEEYAMAVRDFKKFFKRRECPKPQRDKNQRAFIGDSWSDIDGEEDDEKIKYETCLVA